MYKVLIQDIKLEIISAVKSSGSKFVLLDGTLIQ